MAEPANRKSPLLIHSQVSLQTANPSSLIFATSRQRTTYAFNSFGLRRSHPGPSERFLQDWESAWLRCLWWSEDVCA